MKSRCRCSNSTTKRRKREVRNSEKEKCGGCLGNNGGSSDGENEGEEMKLVVLWWLVGFEFMVVFIGCERREGKRRTKGRRWMQHPMTGDKDGKVAGFWLD
ncbi:hypothetical protein HAX54_019398, partial [Datura stramonium]|nr:hypothetical protein [Datura stramonium]